MPKVPFALNDDKPVRRTLVPDWVFPALWASNFSIYAVLALQTDNKPLLGCAISGVLVMLLHGRWKS